jgi:gamma-D-glutamyl-L-lysine dipeptidyl-peptidase
MNGSVNALVFIMPVTRLRAEPLPGSGVVDECFSGLKATEIARDGDYLQVETEYGYQGWVSGDSLREIVSSAPWCPDCQITHAFSDILSGPAYQKQVLDTLPAASRVLATGTSADGWTEVTTASGVTGWVRTTFISPVPTITSPYDEALLRPSLVATARSFLGTQYRWGGKTAAGIDCSGLCSLSYLLNGLTIHRDAVFKAETLREISREALKPGDLVYFPGHVAMYLGNSRVIHSTAGLSGVVINSLDPNDEDYREQLANAVEHCATIFW